MNVAARPTVPLRRRCTCDPIRFHGTIAHTDVCALRNPTGTVALTRRLPASVWIPIRLPGLNEAIKAAKLLGGPANDRTRKRWSGYADQKRRLTDSLVPLFKTTLPRFAGRVFLRFEWVEPNHRRDPDNIAAGKKYLLDALVGAGNIANDGWAQIAGWTDAFSVDAKAPGVRLTIEPC